MNARALDWPAHPYRGLAFYDAQDRLLFGGRDQEIHDCVRLLSQPETRILLLHGRTGCGKSSFLRAGVIPQLEEQGFGFVFLRDYSEGPEYGKPVFIRCGSDPISAIARQLFEYASPAVPFETEEGTVSLDLSAARLKHTSSDSFVRACASDERLLLQSLQTLSNHLFHNLLIVVDQAEEVVTLTDETRDPRRTRFFRFLQAFQSAGLRVQFLLALRTDAFGSFFYSYQLDNSLQTDAKQYVLAEMDKDAVARAIARPTSKVTLPGFGSAFQRYQFEFENGLNGLPMQIAQELDRALPQGGALPVMQILCRDLYDAVQSDPAPWIIREQHYVKQGGVTGCLERHISRSLMAPILGLHLPAAQAIALERRWLKALHGLVLQQSDGSVRSDTVSEAKFLRMLDYADARLDYWKILEHLTAPNVLVLRWVPAPAERGGRDQQSLALGHDALGLALTAWYVRDQDSERRARQIRTARKRVWIGIAATALLAAVGLGSWYNGQKARQFAMELNVSLLEAASKQEVRRDPLSGLKLAVEALYEAEALTTTFQTSALPVHAKLTLADLLASHPKRVDLSRPNATGFDRFATTLYPLERSRRFLRVTRDEIYLSGPLGNLQGSQTIALKSLSSHPRLLDGPFGVDAVSEAADGTVLLGCSVETDDDSLRCIGVLPKQGAPRFLFADDFLRLADRLPGSRKKRNEALSESVLWVGPESVLLTDSVGRLFSSKESVAQFFTLQNTGAGTFEFVPAGKATKLRMEEDIVEGPTLDIVLSTEPARRRLRAPPRAIIGRDIDDRAPDRSWKVELTAIGHLNACFQAAAAEDTGSTSREPRAPVCSARYEPKDSGFVVLTVNVPSPRPNGETVPAVNKVETGNLVPGSLQERRTQRGSASGPMRTWIVIIDATNGAHRVLSADDIARAGDDEADKSAAQSGSGKSLIEAGDVSVWRVNGDIWMAIKTETHVDLYALNEGIKPIQTLLGVERIDTLEVTPDGQFALAIGPAEGLYWPLGSEFQQSMLSLASEPANKLVKRACALGLGTDGIERRQWIFLTGRADGTQAGDSARPPRCDMDGNPVTKLSF